MSRPAPFLLASLIVLSTPLAAAPIEDQMKIVEGIRGLKFTSSVTVSTIERADLPARIRQQVTRTLPYSVQEWEAILRALALIPDGEEGGFSSLLDLYESQVLAYYDPSSRTYFAVRQLPVGFNGLVPAEVAEESVAIHELMHALQDQHLDIGQKDRALRHDTDAGFAYHALLEGEASLVMLAHLISKSGASFDEVVRSDALVSMLVAAAGSEAMMPAGAPRYFAEMLKFPYLQGLRFVIEAYRRGGWKELDRIHADPPRSTREVLHPEDYFERRRKGRAAAVWSGLPASGVLTVEHLGEFHWAFLAGAENATGWIDDRVTITLNIWCEPTTLVETRWESEEGARRFLDAYTRALDERGIGVLASIRGTVVRVAYGADGTAMKRFVNGA